MENKSRRIGDVRRAVIEILSLFLPIYTGTRLCHSLHVYDQAKMEVGDGGIAEQRAGFWGNLALKKLLAKNLKEASTRRWRIFIHHNTL